MYTNSNIGQLFRNSILGKIMLVGVIIYIANNYGISAGIVTSLISIILLHNVREGLDNEESGTKTGGIYIEGSGEDPKKARDRVVGSGEDISLDMSSDEDLINSSTDDEEDLNVTIGLSTKMNQTDLDNYIKRGAEIATLDSTRETNDDLSDTQKKQTEEIAQNAIYAREDETK